ncbi:putative amidohydrolase ytcJ [Hordeum vulgare]|nr:putative amidohydrolase ytcJ [Hordeum vulgare]
MGVDEEIFVVDLKKGAVSTGCPYYLYRYRGRKIHSNQFSVTEHFREAICLPRPPPGVYFFYEFSPIQVDCTEENTSLLHLLTNICAIVGGIFTVAGIIDSFVYHGHRAIKKKMEIGKLGELKRNFGQEYYIIVMQFLLTRLLLPYENAPGDYGLQLLDMDILLNATSESDKSRLQVAIHVIGDKAIDRLLDMFDKVVSLNGMKDRRFRIEHAQHLSPGAANRFGEHGIITSVQPDHLLDDADSAGKKIGVEQDERSCLRARRKFFVSHATFTNRSSYLFLSLLAGGAHLAFGSDWPVSDIYPLQAIKTAMSRKLPEWEEPWISEERLPLDDSLKAHTISAAYASFMDHVVGSLAERKYADFMVLPSTSWCEFADDIPGHVLATYVNGKQAYP